jgi:hypothetical protein
VIAASTRRLTGDLFEYRDLGDIELKGIAGPVSAWQAPGLPGARPRARHERDDEVVAGAAAHWAGAGGLPLHRGRGGVPLRRVEVLAVTAEVLRVSFLTLFR